VLGEDRTASILLPLFFLLPFLLFSPNAHGAGFGVFTQGSSALGQANAVVSQHGAPSAIFFNPALITGIPGTQVQWGSTVVIADRDYKSDLTGQSEDSEDKPELPSHFYLTHAITDRLSAGLGVFFPFGLTTDWPDTWEGRYLATESQVITANVNPVIAYELTPKLTLAAGFSYLYLDATLKSMLNLTGLTGNAFGLLPDAAQKLTGDGDGWGYNLALLARLSENWSLGVSYRSGIDVSIDGEVDFKYGNLPPPAEAVISPLLQNTDAKSGLDLPQQVFMGLSYSGLERWVVECGARWEAWNSYDELVVELDGGPTTVQPRDWNDTWTLNVGAKYLWKDNVSLLFGYMYGKDAIPDETFEPSVPDSDFHLFTIGSEIALSKKLGLDLSYAYEAHEPRHKNNAVGAALGGTANGSYDQAIHLIAAGFRYRF
jgi:long-chain fatty acid transport protein